MVDLILRRGDIQGRAAMGSGAIWGQTIANVGSSIGQGLERRNEQKKVNAQEDARLRTETALGEAFERPELWEDPQLAIKTFAAAGVPVKEAFGYVKSMQDFRGLQETPDPDKARASLPGIARYFLALSPEGRAGAYPALRKTLIASQLGGEQDYPPGWSEEMIPQVEALAQLEKQAAPPTPGSREELAGLDPESPEYAKSIADTRALAEAGRAAPTALPREAEWALVPGDPTQERNKFTGEVRPSQVKPEPAEEPYLPEEGIVLSTVPMADKNRIQKLAHDRGLPAFSSAAAQQKGMTLAAIYAEAVELKTLLDDPDVKFSIGPFMGRITETGGKLLGLPPKVRRTAQLMYGLSDTELRKRSGAQINDKEMMRLLRFTTDPTKPLDHNTTAVDGLIGASSRDYKALSGVDLPGFGAEVESTDTGGTDEEPPDA